MAFRFVSFSLSGYPCKKSIHLLMTTATTQRIAQEQKKRSKKSVSPHSSYTQHFARRSNGIRSSVFSSLSLRSNCKSNSDNRSIIQRLNGQFTGVKSVDSANATIIVTNKLNIFRYERFFHPLAAWAVVVEMWNWTASGTHTRTHDLEMTKRQTTSTMTMTTT